MKDQVIDMAEALGLRRPSFAQRVQRRVTNAANAVKDTVTAVPGNIKRVRVRVPVYLKSK